MPEYITNLTEYLNNLPLALRLVALTFAAAIEYIFPIFPGDTIIILAGFLRAQGGLGLFELALATLIGTVLGVFLGYALGRAISAGKLARGYIEKFASPQDLSRFKHWFNRYGYFLILINRFFPGIRAFFFFAAGLYRLPFGLVVLCGVISAIIFNTCLFGLGYFLGNNIDALLSYLKSYTWFVYILLFILLCVFVICKIYRKKSKIPHTKDPEAQK
jgi:membrane protein DedA with SNARE-associated domain